ncbi:hypothetical protein BDV95DRAFT_644140 [Massariosphaeria phaeospora]|uniref:Uncharacterized protein n=1 Tax=Massariosphaeria phaeospora TaxID=100035 RepID=A0A7C8IHC5_9PLEO|nr:hypothetical protein BDV95DRAFT_644140 [Massariosphaeria phaeospora]
MSSCFSSFVHNLSPRKQALPQIKSETASQNTRSDSRRTRTPQHHAVHPRHTPPLALFLLPSAATSPTAPHTPLSTAPPPPLAPNPHIPHPPSLLPPRRHFLPLLYRRLGHIARMGAREDQHGRLPVRVGRGVPVRGAGSWGAGMWVVWGQVGIREEGGGAGCYGEGGGRVEGVWVGGEWVGGVETGECEWGCGVCGEGGGGAVMRGDRVAGVEGVCLAWREVTRAAAAREMTFEDVLK